MKAVGISTVVLAIVAIFLPFGVDVVTLICAILAAMIFREQPIYSAVAFGINFSNAAMHVPGFVYPPEAFEPGGFILSAQNEVGLPFVLIQIAFMYAGFYYVLSRGTPVIVREDTNEGKDRKGLIAAE